MAARIAIIAMTTKSSISVKADLRRDDGKTRFMKTSFYRKLVLLLTLFMYDQNQTFLNIIYL